MTAPPVADLLQSVAVQAAIEAAWLDSQPSDAAARHEEGGWIYLDPANGTISVRRAKSGQRAALDLNSPPQAPGSLS